MMDVPERRGQRLRSDGELVRFGEPRRGELSLNLGAADPDQGGRGSVAPRLGERAPLIG